MKWRFLLVLPLVGGCALHNGPVPSVPVSETVPSRIESKVLESDAAAADSLPAILPSGRVLWSLQTGLFFPETLHAYSLLSEIDSLPLDPEALSEDLPDPETLDDNRVLSGVGVNPPEDEGKTIVPPAVTYDFPVVENEKVRYFIDYFTGPARKTFTRWMERSGRYLPMMKTIFEEEGLPQDLVYLAMVESGFNPRAYSWAHAVGPWQFIASTGTMYGLESDWWRDERRDFEKSTRAAARFLKQLYVTWDDWYLAVASYNAGAGKISRAIKMYNTRDFWELSRGRYLQTETKNYVPKLLAVLLIAKNLEDYGFHDLEYHSPLSYEVVEVPTSTDLELVAKLCEIDYEEIKDLNPELLRWCTPPGVRNYPVRIPAEKKDIFEEKYSLVPETERANYLRHRIRSGDTLLGLAHKYNVRVQDIKSLNNIRNPKALRIGANLILPRKEGLSSKPLDELRDDYDRTRRRTYTVRGGDSLWSIGRKFSISEKQLRVWNKLGWSNTIRPGQVLAVSQKGAPSQSRATSTAKTGKSAVETSYKVRSGDNLWKIARAHGVGVDQLRSWNNLSTKHVLQPGDRLKIKGTASSEDVRKIVHQVRSGDTLWDIGRHYDVRAREIMDWNNLAENHILRPGERLTILVPSGQKS